MLSHAATDTISGVLGISKFGNWPYFTGSAIFNFVSARHGAANNRSARLKAYAEVREWLALDNSIHPGLRRDLQDRLEIMGVNPMEQSIASEAKLAQAQYAALLRYAADPAGLPARLAKDRQSEVLAYDHGLAARFGMRVAHVASLGIYTHRKSEDSVARLDDARRIEREIRFLEAVAKSSPRPEIVWNMNEVRRALDDVASARLPAGSAKLVRQIMSATNDEQTRLACVRALQSVSATDAGGGGQQ